MSLHTAKFEFSLFGINTYVVYDEDTRECAIIDPGMMGIEEENAMKNFIRRENLKVRHLINTHLHIDHAVGNRFVENEYGVPVSANKADEPLLQRIREQAEMFGIREKVHVTDIGRFLKDGDEIQIGNGRLKVLQVPGHSQGSIALYAEPEGIVFSGDALFAGSVGRTDLPGGNHQQLIRSIREKLLTLPLSVIVYPGHGEPTTIGNELRSNPFLQ